MTQSHKSKQTLQVLTKKSLGKWKRKTIVLKSVENQRTGELYIYHPLQSKTIRKIYSGNATIIQFAPHSHAVIQGLSEDGMQNVLCLLTLQGKGEDYLPCQFFCASTEQEVSDLHKLGNIIQELCKVSTFTVDVQSTEGKIPAGPAFLHFSKNRVHLSSKASTIMIRKEWQFHSPQTFQFEVRGIHIYEHSKEEVFVSCRSNEDNRRIQQIILSQCSDSHRIPPEHPSLLVRGLHEPQHGSSTFSMYNSGSLSPSSSDTQSISESLVSHDLSNTVRAVLGGSGKSISTTDHDVQKSPLKQTQSSPLIVKKKIQSPRHSVKELVDIRYPNNKRSKSVSDLRIRPLNEEKVIPQTRAFSLDSDHQAFILRQKPSEHEWIGRFCGANDERQRENTRGCNPDVNYNKNNAEGTGLDTCQEERDVKDRAQALLPSKPQPNTNKPEPTNGNDCCCTGITQEEALLTPKPQTNEPDSLSYVNNCPTNSPHYENFETRPNCYMYWNTSCLDDAPEDPKTYLNVFSGSSIKGCYENCHSGVYDHEFSYSSIDEVFDTPPPLPQPRRPPPRLPPRVKPNSHREMFPGIHSRKMYQKNAPDVPQRPPKRPPKPPSISAENKQSSQLQSDASNIPEVQATPKIQVALFASLPTCGLVWFLRVAFMHQDENNTTFKRVTGVEQASNHRVVKSELLEVFTDINVAVNVQTKGFHLLNESQQEVESSDIDNLRKGDWFVLEFRIRQSDQSQVQFDGDISVGPKAKASCRRACNVSFFISENFLIKSPLSPTEPPTSKATLKINFKQYTNLCKALDPISNSWQDWRDVADALEFTREDIQSLVSKYHRNVDFSPTDAILQAWEQRDPNCSLERLVNVLRELERFDVVQDLGYSIEPKEKMNDGFKKI